MGMLTADAMIRRGRTIGRMRDLAGRGFDSTLYFSQRFEVVRLLTSQQGTPNSTGHAPAEGPIRLRVIRGCRNARMGPARRSSKRTYGLPRERETGP